MATKKPMKKPVKRVRRFQEGGEAADKSAGLAASNMDAPMGFFERLRMGNIDQEGSQAYNRLGAGRGRMERDAKSELAANQMVDAARSAKGVANYQQSVDQDEMDRGADMRNYEMMQRGRAEGERDEKRMAPSLAQTQNAAILAKKRPAARPSVKFNAAKDSQAANVAPATPAITKPAAEAASGSVEASRGLQPIPGPSFVPASAADGNRLPEVTGMSNLEKLIAGTGVGGGMLGLAAKARQMYKAGQAAKALKIIPSGATGVMPSKYIYTGAKKGGMVKKMASGGSVKSPVSTASKRGDGIALRGKTRGKIY